VSRRGAGLARTSHSTSSTHRSRIRIRLHISAPHHELVSINLSILHTTNNIPHKTSGTVSRVCTYTKSATTILLPATNAVPTTRTLVLTSSSLFVSPSCNGTTRTITPVLSTTTTHPDIANSTEFNPIAKQHYRYQAASHGCCGCSCGKRN